MSDLSCFCDYDPAEFYRADLRKSRKRRKCEECAGPILPGEQYEHVVGKWEGCVSSFDTCASCVEILRWTQANIPCLCFAHGNAIQDCREAIEAAQYRAPDETKGLYFGFMRRIVAREKLNRAKSATA